MVLTIEEYLLTRAKTVYATWGKNFNNNIVFACNCPRVEKLKKLLRNGTVEIPDDLKPYLDVVNLPILQVNTSEAKDRMGLKVIEVLERSYDLYAHQANWYYMVDDDAYVFVHNLYAFTRTQNTSEALAYGFKFTHKPKGGGGFLHGGPGILITNESMRRLVEKIKRDKCKEWMYIHGDVTIGGCIYATGVRFANASDEFNRPRFHYYDPYTHLYGPLGSFVRTNSVHNGRIGKQCCSQTSIGFHYVNTSLQFEIYSKENTFLKELYT